MTDDPIRKAAQERRRKAEAELEAMFAETYAEIDKADKALKKVEEEEARRDQATD